MNSLSNRPEVTIMTFSKTGMQTGEFDTNSDLFTSHYQAPMDYPAEVAYVGLVRYGELLNIGKMIPDPNILKDEHDKIMISKELSVVLTVDVTYW